MSDNEDLLSYCDIGDIDVHDEDLDLVEDQLLMSDDENETSMPINQESVVLSGDKLQLSTKQQDPSDISEKSTTPTESNTLKTDNTSNIKNPTLTTVKVSEKRIKRNVMPTIVNSLRPSKQVEKNDAVELKSMTSANNGPTDKSTIKKKIISATNNKVAEPVTPPKLIQNADTHSLSDLESPVVSLTFSQSGDTATTSQDESCVEESENESTSLTQQSQTASVQNSHEESTMTDDFDSDNGHKLDIEFDDSDDCSERMNAKLCVERDVNRELHSKQISQFFKNQRGGLAPRSNVGVRPLPFPPQFNSFTQRPNNLQFPTRYGPPPMMPPQNQQIAQRMEFRGRPPLNFRPPYQNNLPRPGSRTHFTPHGHAVNRPNFQPNNGPQFPPYINNGQPNQQMMNHFEPNPSMMYPPRPSFAAPTFVVPTRHETPVPPPHAIPSALPPIVTTRKVLINPNFKGGVQAATNQLMMDTLSNQQFMSAHSDAELLRQQEAFINQNRLHIEKRRYERSPERDRERERSYSPPRRERRYSRERELRKPGYGRGGRNQRVGSREPPYSDSRPITKKRRSGSFERDKLLKIDAKVCEPEDEETKKYRLEIEKQKSMREKILRDKEMRRRQAAEEKTKDEEKKPMEEQTTKLTPIIVTEKKIISLKKKSDSAPSAAVQKAIPLAKIETKKIDAQVSPSKRIQTTQRLSDLEDYDEDELLADSPTPPLPSAHNTSSTGGMFSNRRVVLTSSTDTTKQKLVLTTKNATTANVELTTAALATSNKSKGIFDRLERKIGINEASKRKIQNLVNKSND